MAPGEARSRGGQGGPGSAWVRDQQGAHQAGPAGDGEGVAGMRETTLTGATTIGLMALVGPFALLMIPLLFLVAGLLTPVRWRARVRSGTRGTGCCGSASRSRSSTWSCGRR